jgi:RimJ/RimL family protein N-acetyltransferase
VGWIIKIIAATIHDAIDIYLWRNDAVTQKMSGQTGLVEFSTHLSWMNNVLLDSSTKMYIGLENQIKIGVCRFSLDEINVNAEVSINLNPIMRNRGLSSVFLKNSIKEYFAHVKKDLNAKIKKENAASLKCFQKAGFTVNGENNEFFYLIYRIEK